MKVHHSIETFDLNSPVAVTMGTFDGVHLGHREILSQLTQTAQQAKLPSVVLTFFPHPRMVLEPQHPIQLLNTIDERIDILRQCQVDHVIVHPFTQEFSQLTPSQYIEDILIQKIQAQKIIIGYDHRFGKNREADIRTLLSYQEKYPLDIVEIPAQLLNSVAVSSTKARQALLQGEVARAHHFLGYPYMLSGQVVSGKGLGKTIGYPTANLQISESYKLIPARGIYIVESTIFGKKTYGITSIGTNPTVGGNTQTIETYLLDFSENLYGQSIQISFLEKIRDEKKFDSLEQLYQAIHQDEQIARNYISKNV